MTSVIKMAYTNHDEPLANGQYIKLHVLLTVKVIGNCSNFTCTLYVPVPGHFMSEQIQNYQ